MSRKRQNGTAKQLEYLEMSLVMNGKAMEDGPKKKKWSKHDLASIRPLTPSQEDLFHAWVSGKNVIAHGSAGTGKTFLAFYLALQDVLTQQGRNKIILIRSVVPTRDIGFLPGTLEEKIATYELPYHDICWELVGRASTYNDMKVAGVIEFKVTSFLRGLTWPNSVIILEEAQNLNFHEIDSVMTRLGDDSRIIVTGDTFQTDLDGRRTRSDMSGMADLLKVAQDMEEFETVQFTRYDIVRSNFVKSWVTAVEQNQAA